MTVRDLQDTTAKVLAISSKLTAQLLHPAQVCVCLQAGVTFVPGVSLR